MASPAGFPVESVDERLEAEKRRLTILEAELSTNPSDKDLIREVDFAKKKLEGKISAHRSANPEKNPPSMASANTETPGALISSTVTDRAGGLSISSLSMDDEYPGVNAMLGNTRKVMSAAGTAAMEAATTVKESLEPTLDILMRLANSKVDIANGISSATMQSEADKAAILGVFGLDKNVTGNKLAEVASAANALVQQHTEAFGRYKELSETSFFDGPLNWLSAQLAMPKAAAAVNNLSKQHESLVNSTASAIALATTGINASNLAKSTIDKKQADAIATVEYLNGLDSLHKAGIISATKYAELYKGIASLATQDMHTVLSTLQTDFRNQETRYINGLRGAAADAKAEEKAQMLSNFRVAGEVLGSDLNPEQFKGNAKAAEVINRIGSSGSLGRTVEEVLENSKYLNKNNPKNAGTFATIKQMQTEYQMALGSPELKQKYPNAKDRHEAASALVQNRFAEYLKDASNGREANPYRAPSPKAMLSDPVLLSKVPLLASVIAPLAAQDNQVDMDTIVKTITATATMGADGKQRIPDFQGFEKLAAELGTYGDAVAANNNRTKGFGKLGLPNQDAYREKVTGLLRGNSGVITFSYANRAQIANMLYQTTLAKTNPMIMGGPAQGAIEKNAQTRRQAERGSAVRGPGQQEIEPVGELPDALNLGPFEDPVLQIMFGGKK